MPWILRYPECSAPACDMPSQKQDSQRLLLIIEDSVRVMENEGVWFLQCRPKYYFSYQLGRKAGMY
ncbi:hypothetical protein FORC31_p272 (plasmid) [Escherichia coli]|nr:hypothetical protein FORC31_p272 [Escherichia coli]